MQRVLCGCGRHAGPGELVTSLLLFHAELEKGREECKWKVLHKPENIVVQALREYASLPLPHRELEME